MVFFSAFMLYAYNWKEYVVPGQPKTGIGRPLLDRCVVRAAVGVLT